MNTTIFLFFYNFTVQSQLVSAFATFFGEYFPYFIIVGLLLCILVSKDHKKMAIRVGTALLAGIIAMFVVEIIKHFYFHPRPFDILGFNPLIPESGNSFPSGHASFFSALAFSLFPFSKKMGSWFILGAILIALARIMTGIHWPLDILAGFIVGALVSICIYFGEKKFVKWIQS